MFYHIRIFESEQEITDNISYSRLCHKVASIPFSKDELIKHVNCIIAAAQKLFPNEYQSIIVVIMSFPFSINLVADRFRQSLLFVPVSQSHPKFF